MVFDASLIFKVLLFPNREITKATVLEGSTAYVVEAHGNSLMVNGSSFDRFVFEGRGIKKIKGLASFKGKLEICCRNGKLLFLNTVDLENYVAGVVATEMGKAPPEALKAQAVLARTWAILNRGRHGSCGYDFCNLTHCQRYGNWNSGAWKAAKATKGIIIVSPYDGIPQIFYHACCGGYTLLPEEVFGERVEGYKSVKCPFCKNSPFYEWTYSVPEKELLKIAPDYARMNKWELRNIVARRFGWNTVKSSKFKIRKVKSKVLFKGKGLGHGVGLCQYGAIEMARKGFNFKEILKFYFPKFYLVSVNVDKNIQRCVDEVFGGFPAGFVLIDLSRSSPDFIRVIAIYGFHTVFREKFLPGSVFKILVSYFVGDSERKYFCRGSDVIEGEPFLCSDKRGHGWVDLKKALAFSCNLFFISLYKKFDFHGFFSFLHSLDWPAEESCDPEVLIGVSEGLEIIPINMAHVFLKLRPLPGYILEGLKRAVLEGTASELKVSGLNIMAKTGTVFKGRKPYCGWVVCFFRVREVDYLAIFVLKGATSFKASKMLHKLLLRISKII